MTNKTAQRELVRNLYFNTKKTQKEIAEAAGVTERTVHTWIKDNSWDKLRIAAHQMPAVIASNLCAHITNLQNQISFRPPAERFPTKEEAEIIGKMILSMERLKKYPSLQQNIQMAQTFASYTMDKDPEFTKQYTNYAHDFLIGQYQFGTMPYELEYGVQHMILRDLNNADDISLSMNGVHEEQERSSRGEVLVEASASSPFTRHSFSDGGQNADDDISLSINGVHEEQERSSRDEVEQQEYSQSSIDGSLQGQGKTPGGSENSQPEISPSTHPETPYHNASQPSSDTPSEPEKTGNLNENQQQNFEPQTPQQGLDEPLHLSQIDGSPVRTDQPGGLQRQDERRDLTFQDLEDLLNTENPDISHLTSKERSHFQRMQNIAKYKKEDEEKDRIRKEQQEHEAQQEKEAQAKRQQEEFDRKRKWTADMIVFNHKNKMGKRKYGY